MTGLPTAPLDDQQVIAAMQSLRATSPRTACRRSELPPEVMHNLSELLDRGLVREGAPGTYYLFRSATGDVVPGGAARRGRRFNWRRFVITLLFWITVILIPIVYMTLSRGTGGPR